MLDWYTNILSNFDSFFEYFRIIYDEFFFYYYILVSIEFEDSLPPQSSSPKTFSLELSSKIETLQML